MRQLRQSSRVSIFDLGVNTAGRGLQSAWKYPADLFERRFVVNGIEEARNSKGRT